MMFDPRPAATRLDRGILAALQAAPLGPPPDPMVAAAEALAAACAAVDLDAIDAAVLRVAALRAEMGPVTLGIDVQATSGLRAGVVSPNDVFAQLERERAELARLGLVAKTVPLAGGAA